MTEPPAMKKRQAGGSFCAMGGCSNRSTRDVMSSHPGRNFIRYILLPTDKSAREQWLKRMKRDSKKWNPSLSTRVCTDHFFECDFREDDLIRFRSSTGLKTQIRLKPNSMPNTDRITGEFMDPLAQHNVQRLLLVLVILSKLLKISEFI